VGAIHGFNLVQSHLPVKVLNSARKIWLIAGFAILVVGVPYIPVPRQQRVEVLLTRRWVALSNTRLNVD
jgi:hypothetical protein